jgi:hypothetical protein
MPQTMSLVLGIVQWVQGEAGDDLGLLVEAQTCWIKECGVGEMVHTRCLIKWPKENYF